jgi:NADH-quinone oxidoreductase subunit N
MAIYVVMTLGTFAAILFMRAQAARSRRWPISRAWRDGSDHGFLPGDNDVLACGRSPLAGFFAKFYVFAAAMLQVSMAFGHRCPGECVAAYYYLRIVKLNVFRTSRLRRSIRPAPSRIVLAVSALAIILFVFAPSPITNAAMAAAQSLF